MIEILSKVPREALLNCAEIFMEKKIKKKGPLATKVKKIPKIMAESKNVMLAHPYDPDKHAKKIIGWRISEKKDGVRAKWNGQEMESRTGHIYTLPDSLTYQLQKITDEDGNPMELDGELWAGYDTFAFMSGLARRYENNPELWEQVTYMIFDIPDPSIPFFEDRIKKIGAALKRAGDLPNIKALRHVTFDPTKLVKYPHLESEVFMNIEDELKKVEDIGGEGLVLRKPNSPYVFKRSQDMLKVKSWLFKEAIVTGYEEGSGKYTGMVGSLKVKSDEFGDEDDTEEERKWVNFKVGSGLNDWQRFSGSIEGNWKTKEIQTKIDNARKKMKKPIDKDSETYQRIIKTIKTTTGKVRSNALHELNTMFMSMPIIGDIITFRFKELTKDGNPSMPTFVTVRDYE